MRAHTGTRSASRSLARARCAALAVLSALLACAPAFAVTPSTGQTSAAPSAASQAEEEQLRLLRRDIQTLRRNLKVLSGTEQGVLGEMKALEADALRAQDELASAEHQLAAAQSREDELKLRSNRSEERLAQMRAQVADRMRALYKLGPPRYARVLLASNDPAGFLSAYRAAAALSIRDARILAGFRDESATALRERRQLAAQQPILARERERTNEAARAASVALERKRTLLRSIQTDRHTNESALAELVAAEASITSLSAGLSAPEAPSVRFDRFRGLLDWPANGPVSAPFGRKVNGKSGTTLGHTGLDIDAPFGSEVRCIQDGTVVFAQWLRGYGLTTIVDHGGAWLSVYAHASVLLAAKGDRVARGQKIALVGDTGSIRGAYLYFEIRKDGQPVDPAGWLRRH